MEKMAAGGDTFLFDCILETLSLRPFSHGYSGWIYCRFMQCSLGGFPGKAVSMAPKKGLETLNSGLKTIVWDISYKNGEKIYKNSVNLDSLVA